MRKEIRTSSQKSAEALRRARLEPQLPVEMTPHRGVIIEDEVDEIVPQEGLVFESEFPRIIPQSSNVNLQMFEHSIATGEDLPISKELDDLFKSDLEGVSLAMVRGFRRWKEYLRL